MGKEQPSQLVTISPSQCQLNKTKPTIVPAPLAQEKFLNHSGVNQERGVSRVVCKHRDQADHRDVGKRLLVRRCGRLARDLFTPLDAPTPGLRKRLQQRAIARQVLSEECEDLLPVVTSEAEFDPVARRVQRDLKLTLAVARGEETEVKPMEQKKVVSRVSMFLKRKTISDFMVSIVSRGQWVSAFSHWKQIVESTKSQHEPLVIPAVQTTSTSVCKDIKSSYGATIAGFCAAWEKVISRHESLVATSLAVAAGASLPLVAVS